MYQIKCKKILQNYLMSDCDLLQLRFLIVKLVLLVLWCLAYWGKTVMYIFRLDKSLIL